MINEFRPMNHLTSLQNLICTIGNLPTSYALSLSYEEQIWWLCDFLEKKVFPAIEENTIITEETQQAFVELQNYVRDYFNNLDVQKEINNKINEMLLNGTLQEIITSYLKINGVLCFNTINDLKNATNLLNGSFARTFGKNIVTDGKGELYRIRTMTSSDVVDNDNIVNVNFSNTLIAEKQHNVEIENATNNINILNSEHYLFIGDSYGAQENGWVDKFCAFNNLVLGNNAFNFSVGGAGFVSNGTNTFYNNAHARENQISDKSKIKKIIIAGGWNDRGASEVETINAISFISSYLHSTYPNAKIYCGMIGNTKIIDDTAGKLYWRNHLINNILKRYKECIEYDISYLNGVEEVMHNYEYFQNDFIHPNETGSIELAKAISNSVKLGYYKPQYSQTFKINSEDIELNEDIANSTNCIITKVVIDGLANFYVNGSFDINNKNSQNKSVTINICDLNDDINFLRFVSNNSYLKINCRLYDGTNYYLAFGTIRFLRNGKVQIVLTLNQDITNIISVDFIIINNTIPVIFL